MYKEHTVKKILQYSYPNTSKSPFLMLVLFHVCGKTEEGPRPVVSLYHLDNFSNLLLIVVLFGLEVDCKSQKCKN